ncbi:TAXI family TRAP transporter solute-binding subunit [Gracilinema caldarium]|uniref:TAXI family TRAP transporter solute-binding subunit n=1 Tax=Gracilinema caldarium TaxID=215591 RepID=UPI0026F10CA5|nr:TAXI family TRAP transporter solute-binding subunit [Gracilinema caldarium]
MKRVIHFVFAGLVLLSGVAFAQQKFIAIGTGGAAGTYYPLGGAMAEIWNSSIKGMNATAQTTGASVANINLLRENKVDIIFVQNDVAFYALNGTELLKDKAFKELRGMACLYDETVQLVALSDSGIKTVADLKGKRVSVGAAGSGVEANARQILEAAGLTYNDIKVQYLSFAESASNLKDGNIDAAFTTAGYPTAAIQDLGASRKITIVPVDGAVADKLLKQWPFYSVTVIPANTYQGVSADVKTVSVKSMLAVSSKLPADTVYELLKSLYANQAKLVAAHKQGANIKIETAKVGMSIPLHVGAEKFFAEVKR